MKKTTLTIVLLALITVVTWWYRDTNAQSTSVGAQKIATVNIAKVMTECREYLAREEQMQQRTQDIQDQLNQLDRDADALRGELENVLEPGSKEYNDQLMKWFEKQAMREATEKGHTRLLTTETESWSEGLYQRVYAEIARVAQQQGIDLVLNVEDPELKARNLQELSMRIRTRIVVYGSPMIDLTSVVLENLDRAYEASKVSQ